MVLSPRIMDWDSFSRYLFYERKMSRSKSSVGALKSRFKILTTYFSDKEFTKENFNDFIAHLESRHASPSYINNYIKMAKHIDKFLKLNQMGDYTYFFEKENKDKQPFTEEEVNKISEVVLPYQKASQELNYRDKVLIQFAFLTGFRKSEIRNLTWDDVRNAPIPHIIARDTKNHEDHHLAVCQALYDMVMRLPHKSEYVFTTYRGSQISETEVNVMLKKRTSVCKINKNATMHVLRYSRGTDLWRKGFGKDQIAKYLNHKNINTTSRYVHDELEDMLPLAYATQIEKEVKTSWTKADVGKKVLERIVGKIFNINVDVDESGNIFWKAIRIA